MDKIHRKLAIHFFNLAYNEKDLLRSFLDFQSFVDEIYKITHRNQKEEILLNKINLIFTIRYVYSFYLLLSGDIDDNNKCKFNDISDSYAIYILDQLCKYFFKLNDDKHFTQKSFDFIHYALAQAAEFCYKINNNIDNEAIVNKNYKNILLILQRLHHQYREFYKRKSFHSFFYTSYGQVMLEKILKNELLLFARDINNILNENTKNHFYQIKDIFYNGDNTNIEEIQAVTSIRRLIKNPNKISDCKESVSCLINNIPEKNVFNAKHYLPLTVFVFAVGIANIALGILTCNIFLTYIGLVAILQDLYFLNEYKKNFINYKKLPQKLDLLSKHINYFSIFSNKHNQKVEQKNDEHLKPKQVA